MKRNFLMLILALGTILGVNAADANPAAKEKVVKGTAKCAKCALNESATCQTVIEVKKGGKKQTYYLADNEVTRNFHKNVCTQPKKVKATLTIAGAKGNKVCTAKKIELAN
jgi:hypothetical protein